MVFSNPAEGQAEELDRWYWEVHGPDSFANGTFQALHRYRAFGAYEATNLALWEGRFTSLQEAKDYIIPRAHALNEQGRVTPSLNVVWSTLLFERDASLALPPGQEVATLTLVEGGDVSLADANTYRYSDVIFLESGESPDVVAARCRPAGAEGVAPHGTYRNIFSTPDGWSEDPPQFDRTWISHWVPIGSLTAEDLVAEGRVAPE